MRKKLLLAIVILEVSLLAGCAQNAETSKKTESTKEIVQDEDVEWEDGNVAEEINPLGEETEKAEETAEDVFKYEFKEDGTVKITGVTVERENLNGEMIIPQKIEGSAVTEIDSFAFSRCGGLTSITLPESVTEIGSGAFYECIGLTSITLPENVTVIWDDTFGTCKSLTSITLPESVTEIGGAAFANCSSLTSITIPEGVTEISASAFAYCYELTSITIPESITKIDIEAFCMCNALTSITIPEGVIMIDANAFRECRNLTIHCTAGSYAENFAKENGIAYVTE